MVGTKKKPPTAVHPSTLEKRIREKKKGKKRRGKGD
jgi:hypothetical protein